MIFPSDDRFVAFVNRFPSRPGVRSSSTSDIDKVGSSCGFGVPLMDFVENRDRLADWVTAKGEGAMPAYWASKNAVGLDGLRAVGH